MKNPLLQMIEKGVVTSGIYGEILIDDMPEDVAHTNKIYQSMENPMRIIVFGWYVLRLTKSELCEQLEANFSSITRYLDKSEDYYNIFS